MSSYSIKELESLTGIKAHTIRIWELRYGILKPERTDTNIRYYSEDDLKDMLNISLLNKNGYKISKIAKMSKEVIKQKILGLTENNFTFQHQVDMLTVAMVSFNEIDFERILSTNILRIGFEGTIQHVVFPFLHNTGIMWQLSVIRPAQEHFVSNLIRQKIIASTDELPAYSRDQALKFILFLPEHELHEIALLYVNYLLRKQGFKTLYLGASVPLDDAYEAYKDFKANYLIISSTSQPDESHIKEYIEEVQRRFPDSTIVASGRQILEARISPQGKLKIMKNIDETASFIKMISGTADRNFF